MDSAFAGTKGLSMCAWLLVEGCGCSSLRALAAAAALVGEAASTLDSASWVAEGPESSYKKYFETAFLDIHQSGCAAKVAMKSFK